MITRTLHRLDAVLRGEGWASQSAVRRGRSLVALLLLATACGMAYGATMGTFTGLPEGRRLQLVYSCVKVPILLLVTFAISLPSFFVLNTLAGLRDDFGHAIAALVDTQVCVSVALLSLSPITVLWYLSSNNYRAAILFNALIFGVSAFAGQLLLRRSYAPLIRKNPRHRLMLRGWLIAYAFVGIQMGYVLRPFIGQPDRPVMFFRDDAWGNAYELVVRFALELLFS